MMANTKIYHMPFALFLLSVSIFMEATVTVEASSVPDKFGTAYIPDFYHTSAELTKRFHDLAYNGGCKGGTTIKIEKHGEMPTLTTLLFENNNGKANKSEKKKVVKTWF